MKYGKLQPRYIPSRDRWMVEVPASLTGKRQRFFYPNEVSAVAGCSEIVLKIEMGSAPQPASKAARIDSLAAAFLVDRKSKVVPATLTSLIWGTNLLREKFGHLTPDQLTSDMVDAWIRSLPYSTRGRFNAFTTNRTFFNWHVIRKMVPVSPFLNAPPKQDKGHRLPILTVDQARLLLAQDFPTWFRAWLVGGLFAGLRSCEMERMNHSNIDWEYNEIAITEDVSKGGKACRPRQITITDAFRRHMHRGEGPLLEGKDDHDFTPYWKTCAGLLGRTEYPSNCLRHTFASMLLSASQNSVTTAFQMGHTNPVLLYSTYANSVTRRESDAYWKL